MATSATRATSATEGTGASTATVVAVTATAVGIVVMVLPFGMGAAWMDGAAAGDVITSETACSSVLVTTTAVTGTAGAVTPPTTTVVILSAGGTGVAGPFPTAGCVTTTCAAVVCGLVPRVIGIKGVARESERGTREQFSTVCPRPLQINCVLLSFANVVTDVHEPSGLFVYTTVWGGSTHTLPLLNSTPIQIAITMMAKIAIPIMT